MGKLLGLRRAAVLAVALAAALVLPGSAAADICGVSCEGPPPVVTSTAHVQLSFGWVSLTSQTGRLLTAKVGAVAVLPNPIVPPDPSATAVGALYSPGPLSADTVIAVGRFFPTDPTRSTWVFDGHLLPNTDRVVTWPSELSFVGVAVPPNPI